MRNKCLAFWSALTLMIASLSLVPLAEPYSNVASFLDLGMGARPLGMGNAFVGLADDGHCVLYNPAGLGGITDIQLLSSYESRLHAFNYGHLSAALPGFGLSIHYFDFGKVSETDESGNILGTFTYQDFAVLASVGRTVGEIPYIGTWSVGATTKLIRMGNRSFQNSGRGVDVDVSFLLEGDPPEANHALISGYRFAMLFEDLLGMGISWDSDHQEDSTRGMVVGGSLEFANQLIMVTDFAVGEGVRVGLEWTPLPPFSVRAGLRHENVLMWSFGLGVHLDHIGIDYAFVTHPYLPEQHRLTFGVQFQPVRPSKPRRT